MVQIVDLHAKDEERIHQVASILVEGFQEMAPDSWSNIESALAEVRDSFSPDRISRVAIDDDDAVLGWVGGIREYNGNVWELHPLVVHPSHQRKGIGRALVADLEKQVRQRGGITVYLGTDDQTGMTNLAGVDLYPDVTPHIQGIRNLHGHPFEFYQKLGYSIVGVVPDANGPGKPDIMMAKRIG